MQISPARAAALEILRRVEVESAYSSALLAAADDGLRVKDRALCRELVLGVLRRQLWLDRTIEHFTAHKIDELDLPVILALRIGLYQLRFLSRIPASAAVNESVNLVRAWRLKSAASFVNAVLRRATREPKYDPTAKIADEIGKLSVETSHPRWLIERWASQFGFESAAAIARANNQPAPLAFRFTAKALAGTGPCADRVLEELAQTGVELTASQVAPNAWRAATSRELLQAYARDGLIYFQDEASQLVAHLLGAGNRDRVLDVCAGPGSKTTLIAALAPQAFIVAGDLHEARVRTIKQFAWQQNGDNVYLIRHDATQSLPFARDSFDRVLVDAPCSGTGTLRHNPEIRWRLKASDIVELASTQGVILENAAAMVSESGNLIYSTCSLETEENEKVVESFLEKHPDLAGVRLTVPPQFLTNDGVARIWPHRDDVDGFFVAAFKRKM